MSSEELERTSGSNASGLLAQRFRQTEEGSAARRILLVEDEFRVRRVMSEVLRLKGHVVLEAEHAEHALQVAREGGRVDLLVTDVVLPGKNGRDLARELRRCRPGLKTLLISGYGESVALLGTHCNANVRYLSKPFSVTSLLEAVEATLFSRTKKGG